MVQNPGQMFKVATGVTPYLVFAVYAAALVDHTGGLDLSFWLNFQHRLLPINIVRLESTFNDIWIVFLAVRTYICSSLLSV